MASGYPGTIDAFPTTHQDSVNEIIHASTTNDLADAVNKIEGALGVNPQGGLSTLVARLARIIDTNGLALKAAIVRAHPLPWAPPNLDPAFTYTVSPTSGTSYYSIPHDVDLVINWPGTAITNRVELDGAFRHVVSRGGTTNQTTTYSSESNNRGLTFENSSAYNSPKDGIIHVEGHWFKGTTLTDGIYVQTPHLAQVQCCRFDNVGLAVADPIASGSHADVIQMTMGHGLRCFRVTASTYYQGMTLTPNFGGIPVLELICVDMTGVQPTGNASVTTQQIAVYDVSACYFTETYITPSSFTGSVAVASSLSTPTTNSDNSVSYPPNTNVHGRLMRGADLVGGSFCTGNDSGGEGVAGLGYLSPGYLPRAAHPEIVPPSINPARAKLVAATFDDPTQAVSGAVTFTDGVPRVFRAPCDWPDYAHNAYFYVSTIASGMTSGQCWCVVFDEHGTRLAFNNNVYNLFGSTGKATIPLNAFTEGRPGSNLYIELCFNGGTKPILYGVDHVAVNDGLNALKLRAATRGTGKTTPPTSFVNNFSLGTTDLTADTKLAYASID